LIKVIDLFAGPGGLGEGFSSFRRDGLPVFELGLSIEKDEFAHRTLLLRSFTRDLREEGHMLDISLFGPQFGTIKLFESFPASASRARSEAVHLELSQGTTEEVRGLVDNVVSDNDPWILIGGPPCQAYSLIGRARNKGNENYSAETDKRQTLYVEYLQLLADHAPPVFIMENVKGLLSAKLDGVSVFDRILNDLHDPAIAVEREGRKQPRKRPRYRIFPLRNPIFKSKPKDYVVQAEEHGIPQARHRVILLGIREDATQSLPGHLQKAPAKSVEDAIGDLPRIRSGISKAHDSWDSWRATLVGIPNRPWFAELEEPFKCDIQQTLQRLDDRLGRGSELFTRTTSSESESSDDTPSFVFNHTARTHIVSDLERYFFAATFTRVNGVSPALSEFPTDLLPKHQNASKPDSDTPFADRFRVQVPYRPASTVTSHIGKDGHYYIHYDPTQCRSLTVREAARLQTFPDDYIFCGPRTSQYQQVGNAVPPELARQIAGIVADIL
jgi:DNA (cytosine-5)-methyltransferase 1